MHICQIIDGLSNSGAQRLIVYFAQQAKLNNDRVTTIYLAERKSDVILDALKEQGVETMCSTAEKLYNPQRIFKLAKFLQTEKVDVVQSHLSYANILSPVVGRVAGIPVVSTLHTSNYKNQYYRPIIFRTEMAMLRFISSGIITVARAVSDVYQPFLGKKEPVVIPNPVKSIPDLSESKRIEIRDQFLPQPDGVLIIAVGRLTGPKGYLEMIEAFRLMHREYPDTRLIIAGRGNEKENLKKKIDEYDLTGKIILLGERSDVPALLAASDLFLSASYWEGMPISILEAMSAGLPVIATDVGGVPEILEGRGVMVPAMEPEAMANEMIAFIANPEEMKKLGNTGQQYVNKNHSLEKWYAQMTSYFNSIIHK
ncbi:MAG: glycosyltransferase [Anaerolineaceae bacterium]